MKTRLALMALIIGAMPLATCSYSVADIVAQTPLSVQEVRATVQSMQDAQMVSLDEQGRMCLTIQTEVCDGCGGG